MANDIEWQCRVEHWYNELPKHFSRPLGMLEMQGFTTFEQLTAHAAAAGSFRVMPVGTRWGAKWEYCWFRTSLTLPPEAAGRRIVISIDAGDEGAIYVNGAHAGAKDWGRPELTLTHDGQLGARYDILVEAYAGHGIRECGGGPAPLDREMVPEPPAMQCTVSESSFAIWEEEVYQLWIDVHMLQQMRTLLEQESLRVAEITQGLRDFSVLVDFEVPYDEFLAGVRAARTRLAPLMACVNGTTAPDFSAFGHSHIDIAWLWPLRETDAKCTRTFASQLALMEEYPDYLYLQSQPYLYWIMQQRYPELYARIKAAVARGQWIPEGGMWVEADTNISSGESLIRQFLHGKRFFHDEFGVDNELCWLPDVFGYSGALPQIMRGCGVKYFSTQKIYCMYSGGDPFPYTTFTWEGIDGSEVLASMHNDYNSQTDPAALITRWHERRQKVGLHSRIFPFGWGDGGGGPTRTHMEFLRRSHDLEGLPRIHMEGPISHFQDLERSGYPKDRYVGELYFQAHRGVQTTQAKTKKGNRKSEFALREAELWGAVARQLAHYEYPLAAIDLAWKQVLLNQFHDILPGSSIHRVYEEAEAGYASSIDTAEETAAQAVAALTDDSAALTIFNSLGWARVAQVTLPEGMISAKSASGEVLPTQQLDDETLVEVTVPACGWTTLTPADAPTAVENTLRAEAHLLENELLRVAFNETGEIISLFDKEIQRELASGACNSFRMYKDVPRWSDAWDIEETYKETPVSLPTFATFEVVSAGPLVATLRITRVLHQSSMSQDVSLRRGSRRVDFVTTVDWHERHKLLKVNFQVALHAHEALYEIQFGHIARPNHASRPFDTDQFEVNNQKWTALLENNRGCAVLNDCKYGVSVSGDSINLTLLRAPQAPDMTADQGAQEFIYAFYAWNGSLAESELVTEGYELNVPVMTASGGAGERSLFAVDAPNIIMETVKPAEDGSTDIVLRLYEAKRMATRCVLSTSLPVSCAFATNMLEQGDDALPLQNGAIALDFRPFEIKTIRLKR